MSRRRKLLRSLALTYVNCVTTSVHGSFSTVAVVLQLSTKPRQFVPYYGRHLVRAQQSTAQALHIVQRRYSTYTVLQCSPFSILC